MLKETIYLLAGAMVCQVLAAFAAWLGFSRAPRHRWAWLCLLGTSLVLGLRCAIPFWTATIIGLYDFRDAVVAAVAALLFLTASVGLLRSSV